MQYNSPAMCNAFLQPVSLPPLPQRSPRLCRKRRPPMAASIHVGDLPARLGAAVAAVSAKSISQTGHFNVALSGGSLPRLLADALSVADATAIQLDKWRVFLADERIVPLEHADSNYKAIRDQLPRVDIVPIDPALAPEQCARDYQQKLVRSLGESPVFDAVLLGLGPDGHTCSLFPDHPLVGYSRPARPLPSRPAPPPLTRPVCSCRSRRCSSRRLSIRRNRPRSASRSRCPCLIAHTRRCLCVLARARRPLCAIFSR